MLGSLIKLAGGLIIGAAVGGIYAAGIWFGWIQPWEGPGVRREVKRRNWRRPGGR